MYTNFSGLWGWRFTQWRLGQLPALGKRGVSRRYRRPRYQTDMFEADF